MLKFLSCTALLAGLCVMSMPVLRAADDTGLSDADKKFMTSAAQAGMAEVKLGQLGADKSTNADVKKFGGQMVTDHTKANDELMALASIKSVTLPTDVNEKQAHAYEKLSGMSGDDFDKAFVKQMVNDHEKVVAMFQKEAETGQDHDLKTWVAKTLPTLEDHLKMAKAMQGS